MRRAEAAAGRKRLWRKRQMSATQIIVLGFFAVIMTGTLLLMLPAASADGLSTSPLTAMFTSVSATCVTGLVVVDTGLYWSGFGQAVILSMIQIGGIGFMTVAVSMSMLLRRTITPREKMILAQSFNLNSVEGLIRLVRKILIGTFVIESFGAAVLACRFVPMFGFFDGIWKSVFHSISAFCNAGFDLMGPYSGEFSSLMQFSGDYVVNITIILLIVTGGIGFVVWSELYELIRKKKRLSVYCKFVLIVTAILIVGGFALILLSEWSNSATLGELPVHGRILAALFQSVTTRTAGFSTIDLTQMTDISKLLFLVLMFIGGASGSTAGGVKVATFGLVIWTVYRVARGETEIMLFRRKISEANVLRALSIVVIQLVICMVGASVMLAGGAELMPALFEVFSASATVGLSLSLTPMLSALCQVTLMIMMFFGRVGILTITYAIMVKIANTKPCISYAEAQMMIG